MSTFEQILYQVPRGTGGAITLAASSLRYSDARDGWLKILDPWLRAGGPPGRGYVMAGSRAAVIRWPGNSGAGSPGDFVHALIGSAAEMHAGYALELAECPPKSFRVPGTGRLPVVPSTADTGTENGPAAMARRSRTRAAIESLVPLLARVLVGERVVVVPSTATGVSEAALWGLANIMSMMGDDWPFSFITYAPGELLVPGPWIAFQPRAVPLPLDPEYEPLAVGLAGMYADGPEELRRMLHGLGVQDAHDHADKLARLRAVWPGFQPEPSVPKRVFAERTTPQPADSQPVTSRAATPRPTMPQPVVPRSQERKNRPDDTVNCPICLYEIPDWDSQPLWKWDQHYEVYEKLEIPEGATSAQRRYMSHGTYVRCPVPGAIMPDEHYLPVAYGHYGPPIVLGLIGFTKSGKTHLLAAMVGEIERGGLLEYGIDSQPVDNLLHKRFLDGWTAPLINQGKMLPGTQEGIVAFADAFIVGPEGDGSQRRVVALFDVAGEDLTKVDDTKRFLDIVDGLLFVVDPGQLSSGAVGDRTFGNVLGLVKEMGRLQDEVSAAIVLNKADMVRFDEPVTRWLRSESKKLDAAEFLRESAEVYAYLHARGATAWARAYAECAKATLHVASPTGGVADHQDDEGGVFPRGVRPRRVLRPLVAVLAMTGVLTGAEAERVGILRWPLHNSSIRPSIDGSRRRA